MSNEYLVVFMNSFKVGNAIFIIKEEITKETIKELEKQIQENNNLKEKVIVINLIRLGESAGVIDE